MSSKEQECERRAKFYTSREVVRYLSKNGVPKSRRASKALIAIGMTGSIDGDVSQELMNCLSYVNFEVHPQQINVRDKANGKIITSIRR
jgi:hypothetical protein